MRNQEIKFTAKGRAFVTSNGRRLYLDNFIRCEESYIHKGKEVKIHGLYSIGFYASYGICISNCGTSAKVYYITY